MSPPESSTIASYVTLRKTKKPESRCDRPRSAVDQMGFGERDFIRTRMSVEEQLERMRRNQEASSLREKRRETLSRSSSFNKDNPLLHLQRRAQTEVACLNSVELETALLQLKVAQKEQTEATPGANTVDGPPISPQLCESQRVIIVDLGTDPKRVEIVNFQPFEDDDQDLTSSPANILTENSFQPSTPEPKEQETEESLTPSQEEHLDSCKQLTGDSKTHNINSNMLSDVHRG
ncbi:PREDICTED: pleckstrin homology domain-containing family A member 5-like isoform X2 [Poecilia mexicana]|uniref:pleckstrin homology domain-containing family A member 5-like isoform X2 n=1 Tax=Poecilia mexicana TaxID=48701 RepID=UPI00072D96B7|nr:PREDICTED: pleckstrin homology domain-containing family A member 5-like isoform X2 [Poecilia mexicana]